MIRSMVCDAEFVWSVDITKWPVSAAVSAVPMDKPVAHLTNHDNVRGPAAESSGAPNEN